MLYLCVQEPKAEFRKGYVVVVAVIEAKSASAALREFSPVIGYDANAFKRPKVCKLEVGKEYRL